MTGTIDDALPWPRPERNEQEEASETTPGGTKATRWVTVAENLNPGQATIIKSRLESEDIPAFIQQEAMGSVLLGLTVGPLGSAKVLVPEPLVEQVLSILSETFEEDAIWDEDSPLDEEPS